MNSIHNLLNHPTIVTHYSESHRFYHNLKHVKMVVDRLMCQRHLLFNPETTLYAAVFHDIVYSPGNQLWRNEHESCVEFTRFAIDHKIQQNVVEDVNRMIMATEKHVISDSIPERLISDTKLLIDADLLILSEPREAFAQYERSIRLEHVEYSDLVYNTGRLEVMQNFAMCDTVYLHDANQHLNEPAKQNIVWLINQLVQLLPVYRFTVKS